LWRLWTGWEVKLELRKHVPRILPNEDLFTLLIRIFDSDVEHLAEVLSEGTVIPR
jgi:hypothetical protein